MMLDLTWQEVKDFVNSIDQEHLSKKVELIDAGDPEGIVMTKISFEKLSEDYYHDKNDELGMAYAESDFEDDESLEKGDLLLRKGYPQIIIEELD